MKLAALVALALTGCYRPGAEISCTVQCNAAHPCEGAMNCERGLCRDPLAPACSNDAGLTDADPDALGIDAPIPVGCWGSLPHQYCQMPAPTGTLDITTRTMINTDSDPLCTFPANSPYCVIAYQAIVIRAEVEGYGSKPLLFVATNSLTITVTGEVDVSALGFTPGGPGAGGVGCTAGASGTVGNTSSSGGAGGTFAGLGGFGGAGDAAGGAPGGPETPSPTTVRGGCAGSAAGGSDGGPPGLGGGAIVLIAGGTLSVHGPVLARGAGGAGGGLRSGGGGGGSGGMIVLDGMHVIVSSSLIAGGGGGGGGGSSEGAGGTGSVAFVNGSPGQGGYGGPTTTVTPGNGPGSGGGGSGTLPMPLDGQSGFVGGISVGGGGGGGGAGVIWIKGTFTNQGATIVPAAP